MKKLNLGHKMETMACCAQPMPAKPDEMIYPCVYVSDIPGRIGKVPKSGRAVIEFERESQTVNDDVGKGETKSGFSLKIKSITFDEMPDEPVISDAEELEALLDGKSSEEVEE